MRKVHRRSALHSVTVQLSRIQKGRCTALEARMCEISNELAHWQKACRDAYNALDEHKSEHGRLRQKLYIASAERHSQKPDDRKVWSVPVICDPKKIRWPNREDTRALAPAASSAWRPIRSFFEARSHKTKFTNPTRDRGQSYKDVGWLRAAVRHYCVIA